MAKRINTGLPDALFMEKLLFVDVETTGIDENLNEPHQISLMIVISGKLARTHTLYAQPINWNTISPEALEKCNVTLETLKTYPKPEITHQRLVQIFDLFVDKFNPQDKFICVGQNVRFDMKMLNAWFRKLQDPYFYSWVNSRMELDILPLTRWFQYLKLLPELPDSKLGTICQALGIRQEKEHDAADDIAVTKKVFDCYSTALRQLSPIKTTEEKSPKKNHRSKEI